MQGTGSIPEWSAAARLEGESAQHYRWFLRYLNLGEARTLADVAGEVGRHAATVRRVAARHRWVHRARTREWELDQQEADELRRGASAVAGQVLSGAVSQTRQLTRVSVEADPDPNRVPLRDISTGLRDMIQVAQAADGLAQARSARPRPADPDTSLSGQDQARSALMEALSAPDPAHRTQAARALLSAVEEQQGANLDDLVQLVAGAVDSEVGEGSSRRVAERLAQPEVTGGHQQ